MHKYIYLICCKFFIYSYWCAYGPQSTHTITMKAPEQAENKRLHCESIKVGCQCYFIVRRLQLRPDDAVIIYTMRTHNDKSNVVCHGNNAINRPQKFNYAPHLSKDIRTSVQDLIQKGFNVTMIWDKLISDVNHGSGELFTGISRDAFMTRQDILNIYNDMKRLEYVKDENDPRSVECWFNECPEKFFFYQKQDVNQNIPFTIGIQTRWMRSMMVKHSHNNIISMDSTFSTNKYGVSTCFS